MIAEDLSDEDQHDDHANTHETAKFSQSTSFKSKKQIKKRPQTAGATIGRDTETVTPTMLRQICREILSKGDDEGGETMKSTATEGVSRAAYDPSAPQQASWRKKS